MLDMAFYTFLKIKGSSVKFNTQVDTLHINLDSAEDVAAFGPALAFTSGGDTVTPLDVTWLGARATTTFTFTDSSQMSIDDHMSRVVKDNSIEASAGTTANNQLFETGGNDFPEGHGGSNDYVVGIDRGTDLYRDSGTAGIDLVVAGTKDAVMRLGGNAFRSTCRNRRHFRQ